MNKYQKILTFTVLLLTFYLLFLISKYWYADVLFAKARLLNQSGKPLEAQSYLLKAIRISKNEALYHLELAMSYTDSKDIELAINEAKLAQDLSPANVNIKRTIATMYLKFALLDKKYLVDTVNILKEALVQAPTNPKLLYNLGLTYARLGQGETALQIIEKTVEIKPNYKDARLAYALLLIDDHKEDEAKAELEYILTYIDPNDSITKQTLDGL